MIPEALFHVSSVTRERSRIYQTPLGVFSFFRIPCNYFKAGVRAEMIDQNDWVFVVGPLRAIADLIYRHREVSWKKDGERFLTDSLRIEKEDLHKISLEDFNDVYNTFRNKRVREFLMGLKGVIHP